MRLLPLSSGYYCNNRAQSSFGLLQAILPFQTRLVRRQPRWARMESTTTRRHHRSSKDNKKKLVVIMGATGTGKSRLSIDLATRLPFPCEVINSDKMQVYRGLDITTNKISMLDRRGVPHHLLGFFDAHREFSALDYRSLAASTISSITARRRLPLLVGGSNSFIHALLTERFNPNSHGLDSGLSYELRYNCCFIWVDVSLGVLCDYLRYRVDDMLESGMFEELAKFYDREEVDSDIGIRKAIGVPEFDRYFRSFPPWTSTDLEEDVQREKERKRALEEAVVEIKENTSELAKIQMEKIQRLRIGWNLKRLDATEAFRAVLAKDTGKWAEVWEKDVVGPCVKIVKHFLEE